MDAQATRQADKAAGPSPTAVQTTTVYGVIFAIAFCHMLNDMMQSLLPAIYPNLKASLGLNFGQIGLITFVFQVTASLLQPLVGLYADKRPMPLALPGGTLFTLAGLAVLSVAHAYPVLLLGACLLGMGSSIFHPESSRVARMASGGRHGFAQSMFQVGGNTGQALGPLAAAVVVARWGQSSLAAFALMAMLSGAILWNVGVWYKQHGLARLTAANKARAEFPPLPRGRAAFGIFILMVLITSKFLYLSSLSSYYTFFLIERFHLSVQAAQLHLFAFLAAVAVGTFVGGPIGDRFGRKYVIWFSILGMLPFTLMLPFANLFWTGILSVIIGLVMASAFPAIVVYAQELLPGRLGMVSGLFYGFAFGMGGLGAALLGALADATSITFVYKVCAFLPMIGLLTMFLPNLAKKK